MQRVTGSKSKFDAIGLSLKSSIADGGMSMFHLPMNGTILFISWALRLRTFFKLRQPPLSGIFVPHNPQIVSFLASEDIKVTVTVKVNQFDTIELNALFSTANFVRDPIAGR